MSFDPLKPPYPAIYNEWNKLRKERTQQIIDKQNIIHEQQIRKELLSTSMIAKAGFKKNISNYTWER